MRIAFALMMMLAVGCSSTKPKVNPPDSVRQRILERREYEIRRQAPILGIPVDLALSVKVSKINLCPETGSSGDGSYSCDQACTRTQCVHAWMAGSKGAKSVEYLFVTPNIPDGVIAHECHHELIVLHYGITGHPTRSTITRISDGKTMTINHASVIGWRWPSLVNWAIPKAYEIESEWHDEIKCGADDVLVDGAGI
jgi:hypothetical protein